MIVKISIEEIKEFKKILKKETPVDGTTDVIIGKKEVIDEFLQNLTNHDIALKD